MPVTCTVSEDAPRVVMTFFDPYTVEEWRDCMQAIVQHPRLCGPFTILVDRRSSAPPTVTFVQQMIDFLESHAARLADVRAAVLVADDAGFGMARMMSLRTEGPAPRFQIQAFRDILEAERWLDS